MLLNNNHYVKDKYRYYVMGMLFLIWVVIYLQRINVSILLVDPIFLSDMGLIGQNSKQGLLMTIFLISYSLTNMVASPLGDKIGPRKGMLIAISIAVVALFSGGLASSLLGMLAARVMLGLGQGIYFPNQSIIIRNWFPPGERGKANSIYAVGGCIGPIIAMPFFALIITQYSWQVSFYILAILGLIVSIPILLKFISDSPADNKHTSEDERKYIVKGLMDSNISSKESRLVLFKQLLKSVDFWLVCLSFTSYLSIWWGLVTWLPKYLVEIRNYDIMSLGLVAALPYALAAFAVIGGGYFSDRIGKRAIFGIIACLGAALSLFFALTVQSNILCILFLSLAAAFSMIYYAPVWALLQSLLPANLVGTGSGVMNGICNLIGGSSPFIIGLLIDLSNSYFIGFMYMIVFGFIGTITCIVLLKRSH